jgi:hypothetical protein
MTHRSLACALAVWMLCAPAPASGAEDKAAEEKKSGSFFSGLRKGKKFPSIPTLFSKKPKEPEAGATTPRAAAQGPVKPPPVPAKIEPHRAAWTLPKLPVIPKPVENPNEKYAVKIPKPPTKYLPVEPAPEPKPAPALPSPVEPKKKQP